MKKIIFLFALLTATAWGGWVKPEASTNTPIYNFTESDPIWTAFRASELITIGNNAQGSGDAVAIGTYANADVGGFAVGSHADGSTFGAAFGWYTKADNYGTAIGYAATGTDHGVAVGYLAQGFYGVAVGYLAQGYEGIGVGYQANGRDIGVAVGKEAEGYLHGVGVGYKPSGHNFGIALGYRAAAGGHGIGLGYYAAASNWGIAFGEYANASYTNIAIGHNSFARGTHRAAIGTRVSNSVDNSTALRGTLYLDGGTGVLYRATFGSGAWTPLGSSGGTGDFSSVIFSGGTTSQYLSGDGSIQDWPSGSAYDHSHATNSVALPFVQIANATTVEITRASGIGMQIAFTNALTGINLFTSTGVSSAFLIDYAGTTNSVNLTVTNTGVVIGWSAITLTNSGYGQLILRKPQGSETWRVDQ